MQYKLDLKTVSLLLTIFGVIVSFIWHVAKGVDSLQMMLSQQMSENKFNMQAIQNELTVQNQKLDDRVEYLQAEIDRGCVNAPDPKTPVASK